MQLLQHCLASCENILESLLEIPCIPRVCNIPSAAGIGHHQMNLMLRVIWDDAAQQPQVRTVHTDDAVETPVIRSRDLTGTLVGIELHSVLIETTPCRRINRVADLLRRYGGRLHIITVFQALGPNQSLAYKLRHRTAAYIAVTHKKYFHKIEFFSVCKFRKISDNS